MILFSISICFAEHFLFSHVLYTVTLNDSRIKCDLPSWRFFSLQHADQHLRSQLSFLLGILMHTCQCRTEYSPIQIIVKSHHGNIFRYANSVVMQLTHQHYSKQVRSTEYGSMPADPVADSVHAPFHFILLCPEHQKAAVAVLYTRFLQCTAVSPETLKIHTLLIVREESDLGETEGVVLVDSAEEAAEYLAGKDGKVLLTTGAKDLPVYASIGPERLYPRVLPFASSLDACEASGIPRKNIIAMQGPFIKAINIALMEQFGISYMVTKDSGKEGGFDDKM